MCTSSSTIVGVILKPKVRVSAVPSIVCTGMSRVVILRGNLTL